MILLALTLFLPMHFNAQPATEHAGASTNLVPASVAPPISRPAGSPAKTKAGFLAGAGLVILSLLILATGLALVRTFKQR